MISEGRRHPFRMSRLAACLALAIALEHDASGMSDYARSQRPAHVPVLPVTSCDDDGSPGTLRSVVAGAQSGDVIDLSELTCSTISLAAGAIRVPQEALTFVGPGSAHLSLEANQSYQRIVEHSGHGTLRIGGLRVSGGWATAPAYGGCIYSAGSLDVHDLTVAFCKAVGAPGQPSMGGGIYAAGSLTLRQSVVTGNESNPGSVGFGGGAFARGGLYVYYSTVSNNHSLNLVGGGGYGGGLFALGDVNIFASTISDNEAVNVGGLSIAGNAMTAVVSNSTVSGNLATRYIAGVYSNTPLYVYSSTIAFNNATQQSSIHVTPGGLEIYAAPATLESSIIAGNTAAGIAFDVGIDAGASVAGVGNLIRTASNLMPPDTIIDDPQLMPLQHNGGDTATLALAPTSPAIDHGIGNASPYDQRGFGYVRTFGAAADIGAYELQVVDFLFRSGFDGGMD